LWPCLLIDSRVCTPAIRIGVGSLRRPNFPFGGNHSCSVSVLLLIQDRQSIIGVQPNSFFVWASNPLTGSARCSDHFFFNRFHRIGLNRCADPFFKSSACRGCSRSLLRIGLLCTVLIGSVGMEPIDSLSPSVCIMQPKSSSCVVASRIASSFFFFK